MNFGSGSLVMCEKVCWGRSHLCSELYYFCLGRVLWCAPHWPKAPRASKLRDGGSRILVVLSQWVRETHLGTTGNTQLAWGPARLTSTHWSCSHFPPTGSQLRRHRHAQGEIPAPSRGWGGRDSPLWSAVFSLINPSYLCWHVLWKQIWNPPAEMAES